MNPPTILPHGTLIPSPGCTFTYRVVAPVCRLYDRHQLPWPSCALSYCGRQPSWNRKGRRFIGDIATTRQPSYVVQRLNEAGRPTGEPIVMTLYAERLSKPDKLWWYRNNCSSRAKTGYGKTAA